MNLQTVLKGCAWCGKIMSVETHETEESCSKEPVLLSHGCCRECFEKQMASIDEKFLKEADVDDLHIGEQNGNS